MATILQICQDVADEAGVNLARPSTLFAADNNGDSADRKLLRALTRVVKDLAGTYDWQVLMRERVFTAAQAEEQVSAIPADFLRFVPETFWNRTNRWRLSGPVTPAEWQQMQSWFTGAVVPYFRQRGNDIVLFPAPTSANVLAFEYVANLIGYATGSASFTATSTLRSATLTVTGGTPPSVGQTVTGAYVPAGALVTAVSGSDVTLSTVASKTATSASYTARTPLTRFAADTDTTLWDDELITRGIVFEYRKGERLDYAQDKADFETLKADRIKQDGGRRKIAMNRGGDTAADRIAQMRSAAVVIRT